jgi:hypothetical protein
LNPAISQAPKRLKFWKHCDRFCNSKGESTINRFIFIIFSVILLGCSTTTLPIQRQSLAEYAAEQRLTSKGEATPVALPHKGTPASLRGITLEISELDLANDTKPALTLYRHPATRNAVIDFFIHLTNSEEVALTTLYYADKFHINPFLIFSLIYVESGFSPTVANNNVGSVDRGLFQLNSSSFPQLRLDDFFNIDTNVRHGIQHLQWCLDAADSNEEKALAIYNAGLGRVSSGDIPASTQAYIANIMHYKDNLAHNFKAYIKQTFEQQAGT